MLTTVIVVLVILAIPLAAAAVWLMWAINKPDGQLDEGRDSE